MAKHLECDPRTIELNKNNMTDLLADECTVCGTFVIRSDNSLDFGSYQGHAYSVHSRHNYCRHCKNERAVHESEE